MQSYSWRILNVLLFLTVSGMLNAQVSWQIELPDLGTFSSPRLVDLNEDGVLDVVMGAGREEFIRCDTAVFALNGKDGSVLWIVGARDQIFGSASLMDITRDGIPDIFIGGRSAELMAINGRSGEIIWEFFPAGDSLKAADSGWYNFYNPQFVPDQNGDGIREMLVSNGGDVLVPAYDPNRKPGNLLVIDPVNGNLLAKAWMPDNREIYMSVVTEDLDGDGTMEIVFGTGGETIGGNLYVAGLDEVLKEDLSGARMIASGPDKGFIAPPVIAEISGDDVKDIIVNSVDGRMMAFDGKTLETLWGGQIPNTEVYSSLGVGDVTLDGVPDFFGMFAIGVWPNLESTRPLLIDGAQGQLLLIDSLGFYQISSPIVADFNADGHPDGLLSVNFLLPDEEGNSIIHNTLIVYDFYRKGRYALVPPVVGSNVSSTPWIGDMDHDGKMDVIYCQMTTPDKTYTYDGIRISRVELEVNVDTQAIWGAYMGSNYNGVYDRESEKK